MLVHTDAQDDMSPHSLGKPIEWKHQSSSSNRAKVAEDLMPMIEKLDKSERIQLAQILIKQIAES